MSIILCSYVHMCTPLIYYPIDMIAKGVDIVFDGYINVALTISEAFQVHSYISCSTYVTCIHPYRYRHMHVYVLCT